MSWKNVQYENGKMRTSEGGSGGASNLSDLEDVDLTNLINGQILKWDEATEKFINTDNLADGLKYFKIIPIAPSYSTSARSITFAKLGTYSSIQGLVFCRYGIGYVQGWRESGDATIRASGNIISGSQMPSYSITENTKIRADLPAYNTMVFIGTTFGTVEILV